MPSLSIAAAIVVLALAAVGSSAAESVAEAGFEDEVTIEGAAAAPAEDYRGGQIKMQLVSEVRSVRAGEPFTVGLWIRHAPGWHTYWQNPGVVGVATTFVWDLPDGFKAGPIQWPAPQRTKMATLTAYGYEGACVLLVEIQAPEALEAGTESVTLKTKVGWMACAASCHPGWSDFELKLPVSDAGADGGEPDWNAEARALFEAERGRFAKPIDGWSAKAGRVAGEAAEAEDDGEPREWLELTVIPPAGMPERTLDEWGDVYFFSIDDQVDSDALQIRRVNADGSLTLRMKPSQYAPEAPKELAGIVFREGGWSSGESPEKAETESHQWLWLAAPW